MNRNASLILSALWVAGCNRAAGESNQAPGVTGSSASLTASSAASAAASAPALVTAAATPAAAETTTSSSSLLAVGAEVPDVSAVAQDGKTVKLRELKGKPLVVYFYPKDDTPGCTVEAKGIRDQYKALKARAVVLGVSTDTAESHKAFADKYSLPFVLLDDSSHALVTAFGVPVTKGHAKRVTFVIDAAGKVNKVFPDVNPDGHAAELLEALKALG
jgi:thioredoxin-dependent peroxiredoxin